MEPCWKRRLKDVQQKLVDQNLLRSHVVLLPLSSSLFHVENEFGKKWTVFSSNDYLGLAGHPEMRWICAEMAKQYGMGLRASALLAGYSDLHAKLESKLATLTHKESALLFPTGFAANSSLIATLSEMGDVHIFSDELNHASIINGCRLASKNGAKVSIFRHRDLTHLERLLRNSTNKRAIVITETLFSMDGDFADLQALARLKDTFGFLWIVDEAHSMLVDGRNGGGTCERLGVQNKVDIVVGTLSKAFGCMGGFVAGPEDLRKVLVSRGQGHIFSTSLPMPIVATAIRAIDIARRENWRRRHLYQLMQRISLKLSIPVESWIIPYRMSGSIEEALRASSMLRERGFFVPAIRPPTVPKNTCRLRISLSSGHSFQDVDCLVQTLKSIQDEIKQAIKMQKI